MLAAYLVYFATWCISLNTSTGNLLSGSCGFCVGIENFSLQDMLRILQVSSFRKAWIFINIYVRHIRRRTYNKSLPIELSCNKGSFRLFEYNDLMCVYVRI